MSKIKESALELIGETPILKLNQYSKKTGIKDFFFQRSSYQAMYE